MATRKTFISLMDKIQLCKDYTTLWSDFFKIFADGLEQKKIVPNEEKTFNQIVSLLAFKHYKFTEMMENNLPDPDGILEVLCDAVSLHHLKELSEAQFSMLQVNWHTEFIAMNKCLGKLIIGLPVDKRTEARLKQKGAEELHKTAKPPPQPQKK